MYAERKKKNRLKTIDFLVAELPCCCDIEEKIKIASGQRGEELDRKKYKMLISEYRKFKAKNMKHFRFNSATNLSTFGKLNNAQCPKK